MIAKHGSIVCIVCWIAHMPGTFYPDDSIMKIFSALRTACSQQNAHLVGWWLWKTHHSNVCHVPFPLRTTFNTVDYDFNFTFTFLYFLSSSLMQMVLRLLQSSKSVYVPTEHATYFNGNGSSYPTSPELPSVRALVNLPSIDHSIQGRTQTMAQSACALNLRQGNRATWATLALVRRTMAWWELIG